MTKPESSKQGSAATSPSRPKASLHDSWTVEEIRALRRADTIQTDRPQLQSGAIRRGYYEGTR